MMNHHNRCSDGNVIGTKRFGQWIKTGVSPRRTMARFLVPLLFAAAIAGCSEIAAQEIGEKGTYGAVEPLYPPFYRGIYLTNKSACSPALFVALAGAAQKSHINVLVMDVQTPGNGENMVPADHIKLCGQLGLHPVARVVVFPGGIAAYPPSKKRMEAVLDIAERAAKAGFTEIQFDYIRFSDENRHKPKLSGVSMKERYGFIERFFVAARKRLSPYGVRIAVDVFGRIPLRRHDRIGQKMEIFDKIVDMICPMAYPSHYGTTQMKHDPYGTVYWTSLEAGKRAKKAAIVAWIQAFKMAQPDEMTFKDYIQNQIKAVHDANIGGFFLWNARQVYDEPLMAVKEYYDAAE